MDTIYLTPDWDLCADTFGNIAKAQAPYAIAQDVASAIKLFKGELWYDARQGVPYFKEILGHRPPLSLFKHHMETAALTVPQVVQAKCAVQALTNRQITAQVQFTDNQGNVNHITL
jgi:hypothetical protein